MDLHSRSSPFGTPFPALRRDAGGAGSGGRTPHAPPSFLVVGRVVAPHGIKGEVRVVPLDTGVERLLQLSTVHCRLPSAPGQNTVRRQFVVEQARAHRGQALLVLEGVRTRDDAEALRGALLEVSGEKIGPLEADEFYVFELVGCRVESVDGRQLGRISDVLETGANDVYVVRGPAGDEILIPAVAAMVKHIDVVSRLIIVDPWPGLPGLADE